MMDAQTWIVIGGSVVGLLVLMGFLATLYRKVGPNQALIVYGAGISHGHKVIKGGGVVVWPMVQSCRELSLEIMSFDVAPRKELYTSQGVAVLIDAVTQLKVRSEDESIRTAAEQFLDKPAVERDAMIKLVMEGHLRGIVGQLTVEQIVKEPEMVGDKMRSTCSADLTKMGLEVISFTIKEVRDQNEYIANMGMPDIARIKREANIAAAEAQKDTEIRIAQAQREAAVARAKADQERVAAETASLAQQAEANRDLQIKQQQYQEMVQNQKAQADKAYEIQVAVQDQKVVAEKLKVQLIEREQLIKIQEAEIKRKEAELQATIIKAAETDAQRIKLLAEAEQSRLSLEAEGRAQAALKEGQANADVTRVTGEAQAQVIRATGEAEAQAMQKKADAFKGYNEAAVLDKLLNGLPEIVGRLASPLAKLDRITVVSTGGGNGSDGTSGTGVDRITGDVAKMVAQVPALIETLSGVKLGELLKALPRISAAVQVGDKTPPPTPPQKRVGSGGATSQS
jgi:flotillin